MKRLFYLLIATLVLSSLVLCQQQSTATIGNGIPDEFGTSIHTSGIVSSALSGTHKLWTANDSCSWDGPGNWFPTGVPSPGDTVEIPGGLCAPTYPDSLFCSLIIDSLGVLKADTGARMDLQFLVNKGTIQVVKGTNLPIVRITDSVSGAVSGNGKFTGGPFKMQRPVKQGDVGYYNFESKWTYIRFSPGGTFPSPITMTVYPDTTPAIYGPAAKNVGFTVDMLHHALVSTTPLNHFTIVRASGTVPIGSTQLKGANSVSSAPTPIPFVPRRVYDFQSQGGLNFQYSMSIRYDSTEIPPGRGEDSLQLGIVYGQSNAVLGGWNMVSVPLNTFDFSDTAVFPTAVTDIYRYTGTYQTASTLSNGEGYWAKFASAGTIWNFGDERLIDTINVVGYWNMVGGLSEAIPESSVTSSPGGIIVSPFFGYSGGYFMATTLVPFKGYWVKISTGGGTLIMDAAGYFAKREERLDILKSLACLTIADSKCREQNLYFGSLPASADLSYYELPPIAPQVAFDARFRSGRFVESLSGWKNTPMPIAISGTEYPLTIHWKLPETVNNIVLNAGTGRILLNRTGSLVVTDPSQHLSLSIASESNTPAAYALEPNYPNPFNPTTQVKFQLPAESQVTLKVYDLL